MLELIQDVFKSKEYNYYDDIPSKLFEDFVYKQLLPLGKVTRQFRVPNRGDGRPGKIDFVVELPSGALVAIEVDRKTPRQKSIFKTRSLAPGNAFVITRSPLFVKQV